MSSYFARFSDRLNRGSSSRNSGRKAPRSTRLALENLESRELLSASSWDVLPTCDELDLNPIENAAPLDASTPSCEALLAAIDDTRDASQQDVFYEVAPPDSPETTIGEFELDEIVPNETTFVVTSLSDSINDAGSLRYLISIAQDGDTIKFDSSLNGKTITLGGQQLTISRNITIDASTLWNESTQTPGITINANQKSRVFYANGVNVAFNGLAIVNGKVTWNGSYTNWTTGGGVCFENGTCSLTNCLLTGNTAQEAHGGGAGFTDTNVTFTNCTITGNMAQNGGGIYCAGGQGTFVNCSIVGNTATSSEGGVFASSGTFTNCIISGNYSKGSRGGVDTNSGIFTNCVISDNHAETSIGGIAAHPGTFTNCVILGNHAKSLGVGFVSGNTSFTNCVMSGNYSDDCGLLIYERDAAKRYGETRLYNCTIAANSFKSGTFSLGESQYLLNSKLYLYNSIVADNSTVVFQFYNDSAAYGFNTLSKNTVWNGGSSNYILDPSQPLFSDVENGDLALATFSQAINKGNNSYASAEFDLAGNVRVAGTNVDLGAYEYQPQQLAAPSLKGTATGSTIKLSWNSIGNAQGYEIDFNGTTTTLDATTTNCTFTGLQESTSYDFKLRAIGDECSYLTSEDSTLTVKTAALTQLARPTLVASETGSNSITVNWNSVPNAASYAISYALKSSSPQYETVSVAASKSSYTIDGLESNKNYYVKIQAKGDGIWYKDSQQSATLTTKTALAIPEFANISATASTITVNWNAVSGATGYEVICGGLATTFDATDRTATFAGLSPNTSYSIQIKAFGNGTTTFDSDYSEIVKQATTPLVQLDRPVLTLDARAASSLTVKWDAIPNATAYVFSYALKTSSPQYQTTTLDPSATSYTIDGLDANKYYYVKIQALGDGIETTNSKQSATLTAKTSLAPPTITSKSSTASTITVSWSAVSGASGYEMTCGDQVVTVAASATSTTFYGLTAKTNYSLQIKALGDGTASFDSEYSAVVTQTTKALAKLDRPIVTLSGQTSSTLTVEWNEILNTCGGYALSYAVKSSTPEYQTIDLGVDETSFTIDGLDPNKNYYVKVQAFGDGIEYADSSQSATLTAKTGLAIPEFTTKTAAAKSITVKWSAVSGAAGYAIVCGDQVATVEASKTTATFNGLTPNTEYSIAITALGNGTSSFDSDVSAPVSLTTAPPPQLDRPTLTATARTSSTIAVAWEAIPNASGYTISYAVKSATPEYRTATVDANATSYVVEGLDPNTNYYLKVRADADGIQFADSKQSATITYKTALAVPTITEQTATPTAMTINWEAIPSATGYEIVCGEATKTVAASATSATFDGLTANTAYTVKIKALGNGTSTFDSDYTAEVAYSTAPAAQLERPTLTASGQTSTTLTVSWDADPNAKSYVLSYAVKSSSPQYITKSIAATESSYTITGLQANTNYYVKIQAKGDGVNYKDSKQSATITAKTALAAPTIASTSATANSITVNWSAVSGASGYIVLCGGKTKTVASSTTSTTFTGLTAKTAYEITVKAKGNGTSTFDSDVSAAVTQETSGATQLARPVLEVTGTTSSSIAVAWEAIPNAQSYTISYAVKSTTPEYRTITLAGTATSFNITGLQANTNYYVKIRANGDGDSYLNSAQSATQTARTAAANSLAILDTAFDEEFFEEELDELLAVNWLDN